MSVITIGKCKLNPDEHKECACLVIEKCKRICDVYDEPVSKLKRCPLK